MRFLDSNHGRTFEEIVEEHVAMPTHPPVDRAFVRLNMISSADGGSVVAGVSGGLGNRDDHAVYQALRNIADGVPSVRTVIAEHYRPPEGDRLRIYVVADTPDISGNPELFASGKATLVLPEDVGPAPAGVPEMRAGSKGIVDLHRVLGDLSGKLLVAEGGPTLAGVLASLGLIDEFFLTVAPRVIAGTSGRVVHGPDADAEAWRLEHGLVDDDGFLFLRYVHAGAPPTAATPT